MHFLNRRKVLKFLKIFFALFFLVLVIFLLIVFLKKPSHDRVWWESLSVLPYAEIDNQRIFMTGIRNWSYDQNGPVTKTWINRQYNLENLERVWFFVVPFNDNKHLAHTMVSFDFKDQEPLAISIEARKEIGETYKLIPGLLNEYEMIYIWGTERDFIGDRILSRGDTIYMYPIKTSSDFNKKLLLDLLDKTNQIYEKPRFYNTLINNCTNELALSANDVKKKTIPLSLARVFSNYSFNLLFDLGYIDDSDDKEIVRTKYNITDIVKANINYSDFSKRLREGIGDLK